MVTAAASAAKAVTLPASAPPAVEVATGAASAAKAVILPGSVPAAAVAAVTMLAGSVVRRGTWAATAPTPRKTPAGKHQLVLRG